jgi:hypothetical protein
MAGRGRSCRYPGSPQLEVGVNLWTLRDMDIRMERRAKTAAGGGLMASMCLHERLPGSAGVWHKPRPADSRALAITLATLVEDALSISHRVAHRSPKGRRTLIILILADIACEPFHTEAA